jgi:tetratricopeptide (TPR) repeat protein
MAPDRNLRLCALTELVLPLRMSGRLNEAEQAAREGLELAEAAKTSRMRLLYELGAIYRTTGRRDEAVGAFREALARVKAGLEGTVSHVALARIQWDLAELRYEAKEYAAAAELFQDILRHEAPDDPHRCFTLAWLGDCFLGVGARLQATQCYEEVLTSSHADESLRALAREGLAAIAEM